MSSALRVILWVESSSAAGRALLSGVCRYARQQGSWSLCWDRRAPGESWPDLREIDADGIVLADRKKALEATACGIPVLYAGWPALDAPGVVNVLADAESAGYLAAEHLLECGFRNFAACGLLSSPAPLISTPRNRLESFVRRVQDAGCGSSAVFDLPVPTADSAIGLRNLARWLDSLSKPVGVMASDDECGRWILEACNLAGLGVPDTVGVVGVGNDEFICGLSEPPLSSVALNYEQAAFEAAQVLHRMMAAAPVVHPTITASATLVATRRSTDFLAVDDLHVAKALRFIRNRAGQQLSVSDVVTAAGLSRRALEKRFRAMVGRSILEEIRRVRTDQIARLLLETALPVAEIAELLGFADTQHIARYFRAGKRLSPGAYRSLHGSRALTAAGSQNGDSFPQTGVVSDRAKVFTET
jgi:LacI family transcriptional regulator